VKETASPSSWPLGVSTIGHLGSEQRIIMSYHSSLSISAMLLLLVRVGTEPCVAQNSPPVRIYPKACSQEERLQLGNGNSPRPSSPSKDQTLSEKLDQTEGVICPPPGIDSEIVAPPPGGGITPVIPPPGSPGGDPTVRPK